MTILNFEAFMKKRLTFIFILIIAFAFSGCNDSTGFKSNSNESEYSKQEIQKSTFSEAYNSEEILDTSSIYDFDKKYFVNKLNDRLLKEFIQMYNTVSTFQKYMNFSTNISNDELDILMYLLNYDCPELIQIGGDYYPEYTNSECTEVSAVTFSYIMNKDEYNKYYSRLNTFFDNLKNKLKNKSDFEKEKYVYDCLFNNCVYNETDNLSGSVCGAILNNKGRCEALSKSMVWCMRQLDVECMAVLGKPKWEVQSVYSNHSWNIIKIDGNYYHLDLTLDNIKTDISESNSAFYGFFNVDDNFIYESHELNYLYKNLGVPICNSNKQNYHIINKLYITDNGNMETQLENIISEHFNNYIDIISIKFQNTTDYNSFIENKEEYISDVIKNLSEQTCYYQVFNENLSKTAVLSFTSD